jgi:hypothetical protein
VFNYTFATITQHRNSVAAAATTATATAATTVIAAAATIITATAATATTSNNYVKRYSTKPQTHVNKQQATSV